MDDPISHSPALPAARGGDETGAERIVARAIAVGASRALGGTLGARLPAIRRQLRQLRAGFTGRAPSAPRLDPSGAGERRVDGADAVSERLGAVSSVGGAAAAFSDRRRGAELVATPLAGRMTGVPSAAKQAAVATARIAGAPGGGRSGQMAPAKAVPGRLTISILSSAAGRALQKASAVAPVPEARTAIQGGTAGLGDGGLAGSEAGPTVRALAKRGRGVGAPITAVMTGQGQTSADRGTGGQGASDDSKVLPIAGAAPPGGLMRRAGSGGLPVPGAPFASGAAGSAVFTDVAPATANVAAADPVSQRSGQDGQGGPVQGDVYLDGALMGRWMARFLAREAGRPPAGGSAFDSRRNPLPAGRMIGG